MKEKKLNFYEILGINEEVTAAQVKTAYRAKCKEYHPDRHPGLSEEELKPYVEKQKELNNAFEVLGNIEKRKKYDETLIINGSYTKPETESASKPEEPKTEEKPETESSTTQRTSETSYERQPETEQPKSKPYKHVYEQEQKPYNYKPYEASQKYNYYEENDYSKEEYEEFIDWLDSYVTEYMVFLKLCAAVGAIKMTFYKEIDYVFIIIVEDTRESYNKKYNENVKPNTRKLGI